MRALFPFLLLMSGCTSIPDGAMSTLASAGGGCVKSQGMWGSVVVVVGNADKGVIRNGEVVVAGDCGGVTIRDAAKPPAVPAVKAQP